MARIKACHGTLPRQILLRPQPAGRRRSNDPNKITARVTKHGKDPLGWFAWQEILLDGEQTLLIVTAYQVVQRQTKGCGPTTSMMHQWRKLRDQGINDPKPWWQQLLNDLITFLQPHEQAGNKILLMMDANDPIGSSAMDKFMDEMNLCNLMADFLPSTPSKIPEWKTKNQPHSWNNGNKLCHDTCIHPASATIPWSNNLCWHHKQQGHRHMWGGPYCYKKPMQICDVLPKTRMTKRIKRYCHLETCHSNVLFSGSIPLPIPLPRQANGAMAQRKDSTSMGHFDWPKHRNRTHLARW
jgi:hypothetical protein